MVDDAGDDDEMTRSNPEEELEFDFLALAFFLRFLQLWQVLKHAPGPQISNSIDSRETLQLEHIFLFSISFIDSMILI